MYKYHMEERALIESAQRGDLNTFNELVLKYQDLLYGIALRILSDEDAAADTVQEAFLSAFRNLSSFHGGAFKSWLARITVNACYDELRRQRRRPTQSLDLIGEDGQEIDSNDWLADPALSVETQFEYGELGHALQRALQFLPEHYRVAAVLVDVEGFSYEDAAQILRVPVGTVKSRLARARSQLRSALGNVDELLPVAYRFDLPVRSYNIWK